jgi:glutamyl-tRNA synthetase
METPQSRPTTVNDIPALAPFFFIDPDLASEEARSMIASFSTLDRRKHRLLH